jgi:hypothetical protein
MREFEIGGMGHSRRLPIQSNTNGLQLCLQKRPLLRFLRGIQNHQNQITGLGRTNNLSASSLPFGCTLNNPRQIQDLDLGAPILQHPRNSGQSSEAVGCDFGFCLGYFREKRGFPY